MNTAQDRTNRPSLLSDLHNDTALGSWSMAGAIADRIEQLRREDEDTPLWVGSEVDWTLEALAGLRSYEVLVAGWCEDAGLAVVLDFLGGEG